MVDRPMEISKLIKEYKGKYRAAQSLELLFDGCAIKVFSNSRTLIEKLDRYFGDFKGASLEPDIVVTALETGAPDLNMDFTIKQPDKGKTKIKEEYVDFPGGRIVRKRLTGMAFLFGGGENLAVGPCVDNDNQVVNFIINRFIQWTLHRGSLLMHAAGVMSDGRGLAIAGFSGMGKSTLSLHIMNRGVSFISNDRVMVSANGDGVTMRGVPKLPRVNPGTIVSNKSLESILPPKEREKIRAIPAEKLWDLEQKYDVFIDDCFGNDKFKLSARMKALVVLNWRRNSAEFEIRKVNIADRRDLFPAFTKSVGLFYEPAPLKEPGQDFSDEAYLRLLDNCDVYEMTGGIDFDKAATACIEIIRQDKR